MTDTNANINANIKCRSPIIAVLGHVDHGKSSILDRIRNSAICDSEAGGITQAIGASIVPLHVLKNFCDKLGAKFNFIIPGLLFIDTPGHEAFTSLRKRGGNLADIAILTIDINEGFKPQTIEAFEILRNYKTPFIIALNKIDLVNGFRLKEDLKDKSLLENINAQEFQVQQDIEAKLYNIVAFISEKFGLESERYDRCDYTKQIAIVPCSAKAGIGISELLMVLTGLTQRYLENSLKCNLELNSPSKGTILEIKNVDGLGLCMDAIIYDGIMRVNDTLIIGGIDKPIVTKVKGLFEPKAMTDMRDKKTKFQSIKEISAASGVRLSAPDIEGAIAGMPLISCIQGTAPAIIEEFKSKIQAEVEEVIIETEKEGIVVKADTIGSLEALIKLLKDKGINIRKASVGNITKKDITDAESNYEKDPTESVILGFNITDASAIKNDKVKILTSNIIYKLIEDYDNWKTSENKRIEQKELEGLVRPCKIEYLANYTFRANNPAIVGIEVLSGTLRTGIKIMKSDGIAITEIKGVQKNKESVNKLEQKEQGAASLPGVTVGRQINEGDIYYSAIPEGDFRKLKTLVKYLSKEETTVLKEIAEIMRKNNPVWGV
ncbi:MAG TPA: translation initiation factor IF-2 [Alphaproteobacteria bacterium]|nr:translation initiation factor IF-2 [Alphaproteobacteria bacterium]